MSIDTQIADLISALDRNTAALEKAGGATPAAAAPARASKKDSPAPAAAAAAEPKVTQDQVNAALIKIKDDFGMDEAKAIISAHGKCSKMSEIKPAVFQAVFDAAVARHAELSAGASSDDGDI